MRKIGFLSYNDDKSAPDVDKSSPDANNVPTAKDLFKQFLTAKYESFGSNSTMVFRTSRELAYESREMCEPSLLDIATVMTELSFKSDQFCGQWTWVLYEKEPVVF